ncbi:MAG: LuxR C-terminal-related transcriptional regulator [Gammaproteobacteria bacterium]|nr:LuxR C-terminal-related transcriptional regulator [Gammaproteobacteria bacterium]
MSNLEIIGLPLREGQALELTAQGLTTKFAAKKMACSPRNVEALLSACMNRVGANNRAHLIAKAFERGFLRVGMAVLICSTLFSLAPTPASADDDQVMVRRSRRVSSRRLKALPAASDLESVDLSRPHDLLWDGALFVVYL